MKITGTLRQIFICAVVLAVGIFGYLFSEYHISSVNILKNPQFADNDKNGLADYWAFYPGPRAKIKIIENIAPAGKSALYIASEHPSAGPLARQAVVVKANREYEATVYVKSKNITGNGLRAVIYVQREPDHDGDYSESIDGTTNWKKIAWKFRTTSRTKQIDYNLWLLDAVGEVWFAAPEIRQIRSAVHPIFGTIAALLIWCLLLPAGLLKINT